MRDENNGLSFVAEGPEDIEQTQNLRRRQNGGGFVENENIRAAMEEFQDFEALLEPYGQRPDGSERVDVHIVAGHQIANLGQRAFAVEAEAASGFVAEDDVFADGKRRCEHEVLVHHADSETHRVSRGADRDGASVEEERSGRRAIQAVETPYDCGFPRPVFADDRVDGCRSCFEREVIDGLEGAEGLCEPPNRKRRHVAHPPAGMCDGRCIHGYCSTRRGSAGEGQRVRPRNAAKSSGGSGRE